MYRGSGQQPSIRHPLCHGSQRANRRNAPWPAFAPHPISISDETNATMRMQSSPPPQARLSFTLHQRVRRPEGGPVATVAAARSHTPPTSLLIVVVVVAVAVAVAAVTMAVAALPYCSHGGALAFTDGDAGEHAAATHPRGVAHQGVPNQAIVMRISPLSRRPRPSHNPLPPLSPHASAIVRALEAWRGRGHGQNGKAKGQNDPTPKCLPGASTVPPRHMQPNAG
ncbi:hypothetical protein PCL_09675 [Purpureocillium lilacinum]|uniref:Uncharacterized protein n=1 Tax=Purpureocillium lilacinum TaxID=33203 RepID=A0A2U3EDY7_PURLI|nr:hypothetical protein PCL_09675 [Purpureocillium lilacinum]